MTGTVITGISGIFESDWLALLPGICTLPIFAPHRAHTSVGIALSAWVRPQ